MKGLFLLLALLPLFSFGQNAGAILGTRNYVYSERPLYIPMLQGTTVNLYKTSVDSLAVDYNLAKNKPFIPNNTNQLTNGANFLIKANTDALYKPITYTPTWGEIISKPTFATVATSGSYNDLTNKPTIPNAIQQLGVGYTKEFNSEIATNTGTNVYSITATGITTITNVSAIGFYNGANTQSAPLVAISSISGNTVTFVVSESATSGVLIGGNVEGLTEFLKVGKIYVTIKGN